MFQFILDQALAHGIRGRIFRNLRYLILRFHDPLVRYTLNGKPLALNLSHQLPFTMREQPTYSANLSRLASFIRDRFGNLRMIDVGANIGDSHALAGSRPGDRFLLIEGSPGYMDLLSVNTGDTPGLVRVQALLADRSFVGGGNLILVDGTARVGSGEAAGQSIRYRSLDDLIGEHPDFNTPNFLKVDVDGFDSKVLVGARRLIESCGPVIFFEHDPRLLTLAGDDDRYIFPLLKEWGYARLIFYDLTGFLFGMVDADDTRRLDDLLLYSRSKPGLSWDICCFHARHADERDRFLQLEKAFFLKVNSGGPANTPFPGSGL